MRILVVGYGSIGKRHVNNILSLDHDVIICTKKKVRFRSNKIKVCSTLNESIRYNPDVAVITNVTSMHVPTAIKLAEKNIDLFIEKPLSSCNRNIKKLRQLIRQKKLIAMVGCNFRFHECISKIKELISKKQLGRVITAQVESGSYLPDWHPYENYRHSYASRPELGGGVVLTCIHELDYLYWFFGHISKIFAFSDKISPLDIAVEDYAGIIAKFQNGVIAEVHLDYFQRPSFRRCKIIGTKGTVLWESTKNQVLFYDVKKKKWKKEMKVKKFNQNDMYLEEMNYFLNCIKKRKKPMNTIAESSEILNIALQIKKSFKKEKGFERKR